MRILLVSTQRNEGPFLLDWLAHYRAAGVTDVLVYSNDCTDGSDALLDLLAAQGALTHVRHAPEPGESVQWQALAAAWRHPLRKQADWALVADLDEFVNIRTGDGSFGALIAALPEETEALALPWRQFGHNGQIRLQDRPVTELFTRAAPPDIGFPVTATLFKTLFRLDGPFSKFGVHRPHQKKGAAARWVSAEGAPLPEMLAQAGGRLSLYGLPVGARLAEMNHYAIRSAQSFLLKRERGLPNRRDKDIGLAYWCERNFNTVEETSISRMAPATARTRAELAALPGLAEAHRACHDWHHRRFGELMRQEESYRLLAACLVAGSSTVLPPELVRQLLGAYHGLAKAEDDGKG